MRRATALAVTVRKSSWSISSHLITIQTKTLYFGGLRSFEVIDVNTAKKLVAIICYVKQHVYAYLQTVFVLDEPSSVK